MGPLDLMHVTFAQGEWVGTSCTKMEVQNWTEISDAINLDNK